MSKNIGKQASNRPIVKMSEQKKKKNQSHFYGKWTLPLNSTPFIV
jgi:hypothetical protein